MDYKINRESINRLIGTPPIDGVRVDQHIISPIIREINDRFEMELKREIAIHCDPDVLEKTARKNSELQHALTDVADRIDNGSLLEPPCRIGQKFYSIHYNRPREWEVVFLGFNGTDWFINLYFHDKQNLKTIQVQDKHLDTIFYRTREQAEKVIKERRG